MVNWNFSGPFSRLEQPTDPTGCQPTGESCIDFGEACFGRLPALRKHDFQPHQQAAIQAQHQICGPTPEEDPQFHSACEG
jgi:hypothetical protein